MKRIVTCVLFLLLLSLSAFAQRYPLPTAVGTTPQVCSSCFPPYKNLPTSQFAPPIKALTGRYLDSSQNRDVQYPYRTIRARTIRILPEKDRVYMHIGSTFAAYKLSTFFGKVAGGLQDFESGTAINNRMVPWDGSVYPERDSAWSAPAMDGQDRLFGFDWDDRGNIYLAYGPWGFGIVTDSLPYFPLVKQVTDITADGNAAIIAVKVGSQYFAAVPSLTSTVIYDVTNTSSPTRLRTLSRGIENASKVSTAAGDFVAVAGGGNFAIYDGGAFVNGGNPLATATGVSAVVANDGENFYVWRGPTSVDPPGTKPKILVFSPSGTTYQQTAAHSLDFSFTAYTLNFGSGYLVVTGADPDARLNVHLLKVGTSSIERVDIGNYFRKFYTEATLDSQGKPVTAIPDQGFVRPIMGTVYRDGTKEYLLFAANGLGDVYEISGKVAVDVRLTDGVWGTPNPYSPTSAQGPFWGDRLQFTTAYAGPAPIQIGWDHDNAEAGIRNADVSTTGQGHVYQFGGVSTASGAAALTRARKVKATAMGDAENSATVTVSMLAPTARLGLLNTNLLFTQPSASSTAPIVFGDKWVDASDGSIESHFASFSLDSQISNASGGGLLDVGQCGVHTLSFGALYGPYVAGTVPSPVDAVQYQSSVGPITYEVRPFVASFSATNATPSTLKFQSNIRFSATALAAGASTSATYDWKVVDAAGAPLSGYTPRSFTGTIGGNDSYTISLPPTGSKVILTVTVADAAIAPTAAGCATGFSSSTRELVVKVPDPVVTQSGCANEGAACTFTATSATADTSGWTYQWYVDGSAIPSATASSYAAALVQGTHTVKVKVTNAAGLSNEAEKSVSVGPSLCSAHLDSLLVSVTPSCSSNCTAGVDIRFSVSAWGGAFQSCDQFKWEFGDGTPAVTGVVEPKHKYTVNGTYSWKLTVSNSVDAPKTAQGTITVGTYTPPPPPPPPPTCPQPPSNTLGAEWNGQTSGCTRTNGISCQAGETITFEVSDFYNSGCATTSFSWAFGDGTSGSGRTVNKVYTVGGTLTGTLSAMTSGGNASQPFQISIAGGTTPPPPGCQAPTQGFLGIDFNGATSGCTVLGTSAACMPGETITFKATIWNSKFQDCDTLEWDFGNGAAKKTGQEVTFAYVNPTQSEYTVTLTQKNSAGSRTATAKVRLPNTSVKKPTAADFTVSSANPVVGAPITFVGSASGGDAATSWSWTFGDGTTGNGQTVQKTFDSPGSWEVSLVAGNAGGVAPTITRTITVRAANAFAYLLPVVTHGPGSNNSIWRTDLQIFSDVQSVGVTDLEFEFRSPTRRITKTMVMSDSSLTYTDFLQFFTENGAELVDSGVVIVRGSATKSPRIWTRTYNVAASGVGTFGQLIPAVPLDSNQNLGTPANYYVTGLKQTQRFRANFGLLNLSSASVTVTVTAYESHFGAAVAQKQYTLNPFQLMQKSVTDIGAIPTDAPFSIVVGGANDGALVAYGSVIDNISNDPVYIPGISAQGMRDTAMRHQIVPGVGRFGAWRSDVTVFNPDSSGVQFDASFYSAAGVKLGELKNQMLGAKQVLQLDDILTDSRMTPPISGDHIGMLKIDVLSPVVAEFPVVADRTYNERNELGTYGQGIAAFAASKPNVTPGNPAVLPAVRSDANYRTNVGLVNVGTQPASVLITLLDKVSGSPIGMWSPPNPLAPGESLTATDLLRTLHAVADQGSLKIEITTGDAVWAYASIIDKTTLDPEYVPAVPLN